MEDMDLEKDKENIDKETENKDKKQKSMAREVGSLILYCAIVLLATFLIVKFVAQRTEVIGSSMYPTLESGDNLIVEKVSYRLHAPKRFDIIVFPYPEDPSVRYIKRIIGLPGETIQIADEKIYINGQVLEENYGAEPITYPGVAADPITLGDDEYFVLGDNRGNSKDSRYEVVGNIHRKDIIGRAWVRIWPVSKWAVLKHQ